MIIQRASPGEHPPRRGIGRRDRGQHDAGIDDPPSTGSQALLLQLLAQRRDGVAAQAVWGQSLVKRPQRVGIRDVQRTVEPAEALEALPVKDLVLARLIR